MIKRLKNNPVWPSLILCLLAFLLSSCVFQPQRTRGVSVAARIRISLVQRSANPTKRVYGSAFLRVLDRVVFVTVTLSGLTPYTTYMGQLHAGSCSASGPMLYPLQPVVADPQGNAMAVSVLQINTLPPSHWNIAVYQAETMTLQTACGNGTSLF